MPAKEHLWRRGSVFYFRMSFPRELRRAGSVVMVNGKPQKHEVKFSLETSDYRAACGLVATHTAIWTAELEKRRQELKLGRGLERTKALLATGCKASLPQAAPTGAAGMLNDERIRAIVLRGFIESQKYSAETIEATRSESKEDRLERLHDLQDEIAAYEGKDSRFQEPDVEALLRKDLKVYGLEKLPKESDSFIALLRGYKAAIVEDLRRLSHHLERGIPTEFDPQFHGYYSSSPLPDLGAGATLGELLKDFDKAQRAKGVSESTHNANIPVFRALREHFGEQTPLAKITQKEMVTFFDFVDTIPVNCQQRYPGKTLAAAAALEAAQNPPRILAPKTRNMYHGRVVTIWEHGRDMGMVQNNPANIRPISSRYVVDEKSERPSFTISELKIIFKAPLYTGCIGDMEGWQKLGPNVPRRGRFWVPLLALFQGFRLNEACQLEIGDVSEKDSVPVIWITDESEDADGDGKGKRVKNKTSKTFVPVHPTIISLGFLDFVKERKKAGDGTNLFPELPRNPQGLFSTPFSKWFGRFLEHTFEAEGLGTKSTFHSFRHAFRDATRRAMIHAEVADRLGRWKTEGGTGRLYGDGFALSVLRDELAKVEYQGLDLTHLMPKAVKPNEVKPRVRHTVYPPGHPMAV
ncbi:MAG: site-specific integrase [Verrucomicrobiota bacterium]